MDSIENGATIRIGRVEKYVFDSEEEKHLRFFIQAYSLKINKKTFFTSTGGTDNYIGKECANAAKEIAKIMKEKDVANYVIYNGEMIEPPGNQWTSCAYLSKNVEEFFKRTLEENLKNYFPTTSFKSPPSATLK